MKRSTLLVTAAGSNLDGVMAMTVDDALNHYPKQFENARRQHMHIMIDDQCIVFGYHSKDATAPFVVPSIIVDYSHRILPMPIDEHFADY